MNEKPITVYWWAALANQQRVIRVATTSHLSTSIESVGRDAISEPEQETAEE